MIPQTSNYSGILFDLFAVITYRQFIQMIQIVLDVD